MTDQDNIPKPAPVTSAMIRPFTCKSCKHADPLTTEPRFMCRRNPPQTTAFIGPMANGQPGILTSTNFPLVDPSGWCGEYARKIALDP